MHFQLNYMVAQQRCAELHRAGEHARLAAEVYAGRRKLPDPNLITRPSGERWRGKTGLEVERAIGGAR